MINSLIYSNVILTALTCPVFNRLSQHLSRADILTFPSPRRSSQTAITAAAAITEGLYFVKPVSVVKIDAYTIVIHQTYTLSFNLIMCYKWLLTILRVNDDLISSFTIDAFHWALSKKIRHKTQSLHLPLAIQVLWESHAPCSVHVFDTPNSDCYFPVI